MYHIEKNDSWKQELISRTMFTTPFLFSNSQYISGHWGDQLRIKYGFMTCPHHWILLLFLLFPFTQCPNVFGTGEIFPGETRRKSYVLVNGFTHRVPTQHMLFRCRTRFWSTAWSRSQTSFRTFERSGTSSSRRLIDSTWKWTTSWGTKRFGS